jgi:predicted dehydrogenase
VLSIGILGAAGIAPKAIIAPARRRADVTVAAIASRDGDKAARYAAEHQIPRSYAGYLALLEDPSVDLVYNALPPSAHAEFSIAAMEAGKDVLCEKPVAMNATEAAEMVATAQRTGRRLIEAFHDSYHPLMRTLLEIVASGRLGRMRAMDAAFSTANPFFPGSIRHVPELGGGALMDLGCYPVHWLRSLAGEEPSVVAAVAQLGPLGADESLTAELRFPAGTRGRLECRMTPGLALTQDLRVEADRGTLEVSGMVFPHLGHSLREVTGGVARTFTVAGQETYDHQLAAVITALGDGQPLPTEGEDPVANMAAIDAIYARAGVNRP